MSNFMIVAAAEAAAPAQVAAPAKTAAPAPQTVQRTEVPADNGANAQQQPQGNPWMSMLPFILIFVVMIFFMNRSQKKQMQKRQEMMEKITKGTKVLLTSGNLSRCSGFGGGDDHEIGHFFDSPLLL